MVNVDPATHSNLLPIATAQPHPCTNKEAIHSKESQTILIGENTKGIRTWVGLRCAVGEAIVGRFVELLQCAFPIADIIQVRPRRNCPLI